MVTEIQDLRSITPRSNGTRMESSIKNVARHHSATDAGDWFTFWPFWNKSKGWGTGGYHEIILRDGTVQLCYDPNEITNGVGGHNHAVYNICIVGNGSFTAAQEKAWHERCHVALKRFNLPISAVKGHNEFSGTNTSCPGINMNTVRKALASGPVEQVSKPFTPLPANVLGTVEVLVDTLNVRSDASFTAKTVKTVKRGESYKAYDLKNGLYNLGGNQWVSAGSAYVRFVKNPAYKAPAPQPTVAEKAKKEAEKVATDKAKQQQQKDEQHIKQAIEKGIVNGERMNEPLTRRQGTLMIMRALEQK